MLSLLTCAAVVLRTLSWTSPLTVFPLIPAPRVRPWTLRTRSPCRLWGIPLGDLFPLLRMYPAIGLVAAEYVKFKVAYTVAEQP